MTAAPAGPAVARPDPDDPVPPAARPATGRIRAPRARRLIAWVLVVVVSVLVPLSVLTVWSVRTLTNTDRYVATMAPLARDPVITGYLALVATNELFDRVQVEQRIENALPKKADFVAAPVTTAMRSFTQNEVAKVLHSQWFADFWDGANRRVHSTLIKFLKGEPLPRVDKARHVAITITPVLDKAIAELDKRGVTVFDPLKAKLDKGAQANFSLANNQQVKKIRTIFRAATAVGWLLPLATLVLLIVAVAVAVERRKTLLRAALGSAIAVVVVLAALAIGRTVFINEAGSVPHDVTASVFGVVTRFLTHSLKVVLLVCLLLAVGLWLAGPSRWPVWLRVHVWRGLCWLGRAIAGVLTSERRQQASARARAVAQWCLEHRSGLRLLGAAVAGAVVVFSAALAVASVWLTLVLLVVYLLLLEVVFAWARRNAGAPGEEDDGPRRAGPGTDGGSEDHLRVPAAGTGAGPPAGSPTDARSSPRPPAASPG